MNVYVNNEKTSVPEGESLYIFLSKHFSPPEMTYVWLNDAFVSRFTYMDQILQDGDQMIVYRVPSGG